MLLERERTFDEVCFDVRNWCRMAGTVFTVVETRSGSIYLFLATPHGLSVEPMVGCAKLDRVLGKNRRAVVVTMPSRPVVGRHMDFTLLSHDGIERSILTSRVTRVASV